MTGAEILPYAIKVGCGFLATFMAILAWSKTRDLPWSLVAAAVVVRFAGEMFDILCTLHLLAYPQIALFGVSVVELIFAAVPTLFLIIAFAAVIYNS